MPTIRALRERFARVAEGELQKTLDQLARKEHSPVQTREAVQRLVQLVVNKLLDPDNLDVTLAQGQRGALTISQGLVYIPYGGRAGDCDSPQGHPYHGILIAARRTDGAIFYKWHTDSAEEIVAVLSGTAFLTVGEETSRVRAGGLAVVPKCVPHEVRNAIVGSTSAEAHAGPNELLEVARPFFVEARARQEHNAVERWREAHGRGERSAAGWRHVLEAASDGRVDVLLLTERTTKAVWECPECGRAWADGGSCPLDGTKLEETPDGADVAIRQTLAHSGTFVRLGAGALPDGGPAALLRY